MSLTVKHLNDDSTFLLTFAPPITDSANPRTSPGSFTILVDPWLDGNYTVWRPSFAIAYHTIEPSIASLTELKDSVDLIVISQDKSDHCHEETLRSLPRDTKIRILATPAAAKKIRSWKHFSDPSIVQTIPPYNASKPETIIRIPIDAYSSTSAAGEVTISNMPSKLDMANLHNAIGITYCPPSPPMAAATGGDISSITKTQMSVYSPPEDTGISTPASASTGDVVKCGDDYSSILSAHLAKSLQVNPKENREKVLSVLYSPHGVSRSTIQPYVDSHLSKLKEALPLTALFHSLNIEANPWFMGGIVSAGAPGGAKLARALRAKYWIGAHDEIKDASGMAILFIRKEQFKMNSVYDMLKESNDEKVNETELAILECGEERTFMA